MRAEQAIEALEELRAAAETSEVRAGEEHLTAWKGKVRGVIVTALGNDDHLVSRFDEVSYHPSIWFSNSPADYFHEARYEGIRIACGVIDAALYQLRLTVSEDAPVDVRSFDPELWNHVQKLVEDEDWGKVASQTAIFVEDTVRTWAGDPRGTDGDSLVGKGLMAKVFSDKSDWRLGARAGEREGWRFLAMGFTQALSNVDRHRIQERSDSKRYALGVLGPGSLLLTQLRHEHGHLIEDIQTVRDSESS